MVETIIGIIVLACIAVFAFVAYKFNRARKNLSNNTGAIGRIESDTKTVGDRIDGAKAGIGEVKERIDRNAETVGNIKDTVEQTQGRVDSNLETTGRVADSVNRSTNLNKRFGDILDDIKKTGK